MNYKHIILVTKSEKQHDSALQDLRELGLYPTLLSLWERICDSTDKVCVGYVVDGGFCSNGTLSDNVLSEPSKLVLHSRKKFIAAVKRVLGESK